MNLLRHVIVDPQRQKVKVYKIYIIRKFYFLISRCAYLNHHSYIQVFNETTNIYNIYIYIHLYTYTHICVYIWYILYMCSYWFTSLCNNAQYYFQNRTLCFWIRVEPIQLWFGTHIFMLVATQRSSAEYD